MKKVELFEKMDDVDVKIYVGLLKNIEENVKDGGDGFIEMLELMEWLKENDKKEVFDIDKGVVG